MGNDGLDYKQAGVDIDAANQSVDLIKNGWAEPAGRRCWLTSGGLAAFSP
jgi:hypothetical protein